ncbi:MAG: putative sulfate/molybdate transporter [Proteobacteria bacterium]|nr:putative sulfate/molybdate transporter [Pseudomonadota bacterium]
MSASQEKAQELPYAGGILKLRLPFVHYRIEYQDFIQGAILSCVPLGITAAMVKVLGIPIEVAVLMVVINNFLYLLHTSFGDPSVSGWITAGIPLYISYLTGFAEGPERIKALIALQVLVGCIFLVLGVTGITRWVIKHFPVSMRAGILLGAGFASLMRVFDPAQPFMGKMPIAFIIASLGSFFILFSAKALRFRAKSNLFAWVAGFGIAPGFIIGYVAGLLTGEISPPTGVFDRFIIDMPFGQMMSSFTALGIGMPSAGQWVAAISLAIVAYVLAFGDILVLEAMIEDCNKSRKDERVVFEVPRNHVITAFRNIFQGICVPFLPLCGPQWTGGQALVVNRYKHSTPDQEPSYWGGATSIFWGMSLAMIFHPFVQIILPAKLIGFGLTLLIQGYLCIYLAFAMCTTNVQRGIAGVMGAALVSANYVKLWESAFWSGPTMALIVGAVLFFLLEYDGNKEKAVS